MFGRKNEVRVMPGGFTFSEASIEAEYLHSIGRTGVESEVVIDDSFVVVTKEAK